MTGYEAILKLAFDKVETNAKEIPLIFLCGCKFRLAYKRAKSVVYVFLIPKHYCTRHKEYCFLLDSPDSTIINLILSNETFVICDTDEETYLKCYSSLSSIYSQIFVEGGCKS